MAYTLDTTLGDLLKDPQAKAVMDQYLPGVSSNPMIEMAKGMSLETVAEWNRFEFEDPPPPTP